MMFVCLCCFCSFIDFFLCEAECGLVLFLLQQIDLFHVYLFYVHVDWSIDAIDFVLFNFAVVPAIPCIERKQ